MRIQCQGDHARRRGVAIIYVLVVLVFCGVLATLVARGLLMEQRLMQDAAWRSQARWLAEAGVARARAQWELDNTYAGEIWRVPASEMAAGVMGGAAEVTIVVRPAEPQNPQELLIDVVASYPSDLDPRATFRKQVNHPGIGVAP